MADSEGRDGFRASSLKHRLTVASEAATVLSRITAQFTFISTVLMYMHTLSFANGSLVGEIQRTQVHSQH